MGYVGIPAAALFAASPRFDCVYGFQRESSSSGYKIAMLNRGEFPMKGDEPGLADLLRKVVSMGKFTCTTDFTKIAMLDAVTIAIQTQFENRNALLPDFTALKEALSQVGRYITPGTLVVLESTVTPGTTEGFARGILEQESGLVAGMDFALAHVPERVMAGRLIKNIREHDRIIGGINDASTRRAVELYTPVLTTGKIVPVTARSAEVTKTAENALRDLQIAAINELALYCEAMAVNVYDVKAGIDTLKGESITRALLYPGAGVGGHCLTQDTDHLERGAQVLGKGTLDYPPHENSLFVLARTINDFMPTHMFHLTVDGLKRIHKDPRGAKIALLGWAFLSDADDTRNTPSGVYRSLLLEAGAEVAVHDPYVTSDHEVQVFSDIDDAIRDANAIALFTAHKTYRNLDPERIKSLSNYEHPVIIDGRNMIDPDEFISLGFVYKGIGRGDKNSHPIA
jgi:UDP-N-acetyl-D-mannosaminuronic acid dehydrogenase